MIYIIFWTLHYIFVAVQENCLLIIYFWDQYYKKNSGSFYQNKNKLFILSTNKNIFDDLL